ncbi:MAG: hypothetical protein HYZ57_17470 [Acidobacteria bacterium]|nr:hypothetical protein [Acidobacteriota bacterium]MBI3281619.1 hypothetical protein [Acidobacteriota bacterium]
MSPEFRDGKLLYPKLNESTREADALTEAAFIAHVTGPPVAGQQLAAAVGHVPPAGARRDATGGSTMPGVQAASAEASGRPEDGSNWNAPLGPGESPRMASPLPPPAWIHPADGGCKPLPEAATVLSPEVSAGPAGTFDFRTTGFHDAEDFVEVPPAATPSEPVHGAGEPAAPVVEARVQPPAPLASAVEIRPCGFEPQPAIAPASVTGLAQDSPESIELAEPEISGLRRARIAYGPDPKCKSAGAPKPAEQAAQRVVTAPPPTVKSAPADPPAPISALRRTSTPPASAVRRVTSSPAPAAPAIKLRQSPPLVQKPPAAAAPAVTAVPGKTVPTPEVKPPAGPAPQPAEPAAARKTIEAPAREPANPKTAPAQDAGKSVAANAPKPAAALAARQTAKAPPVEPPAPKTAAAKDAGAPADFAPRLGLDEPQTLWWTSLWANASKPVRAAILGAAALAVIGVGALMSSGGSSQATVTAPAPSAETDTAMVIGGGGWSATWGADASVNRGKQISIYRPTMNMADYRMEFRGQIERKAMGWIFRARDPKNYYVMKLEQIKPGAEPVVALVKYAVINGKDDTHTQVLLPLKVNLATVYEIRLDVRGNSFTTHIQDQQVDIWTDDRIKLGGAGFYADAGERAQVKTSQFAYLK